MGRVKPIKENELNTAQKKVWEAIMTGPRGTVPDPLAVWVRNPGLGDPAERLGAYARYGSSLPRRLSELAICTVAHAWKAEYEWRIHAADAVKAGLPQSAIDDIEAGRELGTGDAAALAVHRFVDELVEKRRVSDAIYAEAEKHLGAAGVVDLVGICGYYTLISMTLLAFELV